MLRLFRRRPPAEGVRFCDACDNVTTAEQRAWRRYERRYTDIYPMALPR